MIHDEHTFIATAMANYSNVQCVALDEFKEDLYRINTIRKCLARYVEGEELNVRLVLNQLVIMFNVFGSTAFDLLKYKIDSVHYPILFAFLVQLNRLPDSEAIMLDQMVVQQLRQI